MGKRDRKCYLCGEKYSFCPNCGNDKLKPAWMAQFHNEDCKNIFDICSKFNVGVMEKEVAATELKKCDLSYKDKFDKTTLDTIDKILAANKVDAKKVEVKQPEVKKSEVEVNKTEAKQVEVNNTEAEVKQPEVKKFEVKQPTINKQPEFKAPETK